MVSWLVGAVSGVVGVVRGTPSVCVVCVGVVRESPLSVPPPSPLPPPPSPLPPPPSAVTGVHRRSRGRQADWLCHSEKVQSERGYQKSTHRHHPPSLCLRHHPPSLCHRHHPPSLCHRHHPPSLCLMHSFHLLFVNVCLFSSHQTDGPAEGSSAATSAEWG